MRPLFSDFAWRFEYGSWYVVVYGGSLAYGPFKSKERACDWFRMEQDVELECAENYKLKEARNAEEQRKAKLAAG